MRFSAARLVLCLGTITGCVQHTVSSPLPASPSFAREVPIASGFKVLHDFSSYPDGARPSAGMVALNGALYGTTQGGGKYGDGTVYEVSTSGVETVLHSFPDGAKDGAFPYADLINVNGSLYGTTLAGGEYGHGIIFKVTTSGKEQVLHSFKGGVDGSASNSGLIYVNGLLYGTTQYGGSGGLCSYGCGIVFEVSTGGKERVVYRFKGGSDGEYPSARLVVFNGALYGTTTNGGSSSCDYGCGTVFKVTTSGAEHVLHSFAGGAADGANPVAGLVVLDGVFYGTTANGGSYNYGSVYKVNPSGAEHVLYSFKAKPDGATPESDLITSGGMLYGTTYGGGKFNYGTVYEVNSSGVERVLHGFVLGASDGADPIGGLVFLNGTLYGTTLWGGTSSYGIAFKIAP